MTTEAIAINNWDALPDTFEEFVDILPDNRPKPFDELVEQIVMCCRYLDGDMLILVTGGYGTGKSTIAAQLCNAVWDGFKVLNPRHCSQTWEELIESFRDRRIKAHQTDEGKKAVGTRMDARTSKGVTIEKVFSESRQLNRLEVICVGELSRVLGFLADDRALLWIHVPEKGIAMVFQRLDHALFGNSFGLDIKGFQKGIKDHADMVARLKQMPSYWTTFGFPKYGRYLREKDWLQYKEIKNRSFYEWFGDSGAQEVEKIKLSFGKLISVLKGKEKWKWDKIVNSTLHSRQSLHDYRKTYESNKDAAERGQE